MTNISKGLVLLVVVLLVTSISANMVAAVRVNDDTTPLEDGEFNQYPVDDPNAINETSYTMRLTPSRYTPLQSGETVIVTEGDNLDKYLFWPNTIEPDIPVQTNDSDIYSAEFTLSIYDVDEYCGGACNGVCEVDPVYFNGHYLGTLTGANNQWSTTTFILDPSWVNGEVGGSPGINHVKIVIDVDSQSCWAVECDWVQLIINAGAKGNARIVSLSTDKQAYSPSDPIDVAIDLTTDIDSQSVRLETNLYDIYGVNVDGSSTTLTLHKNTITSVNRQLSIPVSAPSGEYTVEAIVYDSASVQQDKKTVIVTVGTDPDFYVTPDDIKFSQINAVPGGLEVSVDLSIHYENGNTPRDVDVNIYKADINTGIKTLVHSETVSLSPGINTVSKVLNLPSYQYRGCVVVDPDNKIEETNENNNEACKSLEGPTIADVKPKYKGFFLSGINVDNVYYVFTSGNVDHVEFDMNGDVKTDSDGSDEWSMAYDMGGLPLFSKLTITAFSDAGIPSEPFVIMPQLVDTPIWIMTMITIGGPVTIWSLTNFAHDNILAFSETISIPPDPVDAHITIPSWIPVIGGEYKIKIGSKFGYEFKSDSSAKIFGGGVTNMKIAGREGEIAAILSGILKILSGTPSALKLEGADLDVGGSITIPIPGATWDLGIIKVGINFIPGLNGVLCFREDPSGGIIAGLGWKSSEGTLKTALEGYGKIEEGIGYTEGKIGGEPSLTFKVPPPYFKQVAIDLYAKLKQALFGWAKEWELRYTWSYPPTASQSLKAFISESSGEWKPIPRDYAKSNYAKFTGSKANLKMIIGPRTLVVNALGAQENPIVENIFPYASPSIATDNGGNAIMVWTHDDINKPQIQGFEIYYSTWDGNSWSTPGAVTDNYLPEFKPCVMFDSNGNAVATWTILNNASITANTSVFSVLSDVEVAYSVWDKNTKTWSTPEILTNNLIFDGLASLSNDINGNVAATWILDKDNNMTTIFDRDIVYSIWNGTDWDERKEVTTAVGVDIKPVLVYSQNKAISVWSQDTDNNSSSNMDKELYYAVWDGIQWSKPTYLTNDTTEDTAPTVIFDKFDMITLAWIKRNETADRVYISTYDNGWSSPELVVESPTIYEMELSFDSANNAVIVWQGASSSSSGQNIFYTVHDNSNQLWCGEKQLTNDTSAEWQLSTTINLKDELMISYVKQNMSIVNYTAIEGESDLWYLIHPIMLDLTLDSKDIIFSDETAYPGDTITIDTTIHNIGDLKANFVEVNFSDGLSGPQIGTTQTIPSLPAGQNATVSVTWNIPLLQQSHDIYVRVDPDDKLPETNGSNNVAFASIVLPDLQINESDVTFSYEHGSLRINARVHNFGVIAASNVPVELFDGGLNGTLINATTITSLSPNNNETISTLWNTQGISSGCHNISVIIDQTDGIQEQNETNNIANLSLMILPDLSVNANNVSFSDTSEGNITLDACIRNSGISNAENVTIGFFDGDPFANGTLIGSTIIDTISKDGESFTGIIWYATPGQHDIYVQIDPYNLIPDLDKSNNLACNRVIITPGADLMLHASDIIFSDVNELGQVTISAIIHNIGLADVPYTTVEYYNGTPDVNQTNPYVTNIPNSLGTEVVPFVSSEGFVMVNLCANWTPMENMVYNIYVKVDPEDNIHESNKSNNMAFNRYPCLSKLYYPDFTDTDTPGNWRTWMGVMNTGDTSTTIRLDGYNPDGSLAYSNPSFVTLEPKAVHFFRPGITAGIAQGSAIVYGDNLAGTCHVNKNGGEGTKVYTALSNASSTLYYPDFTDTDTIGNWRTWIAVMNTGATSTTLNLAIYNTDGSVAYLNPNFVTLEPKAVHFFRPGITAGIGQGSVVVSGDNLAGTCHVNKNGGEGTKAYPAVSGDSAEALDLAYKSSELKVFSGSRTEALTGSRAPAKAELTRFEPITSPARVADDDSAPQKAFTGDSDYDRFEIRSTPPMSPVDLETVKICPWPDWPDSEMFTTVSPAATAVTKPPKLVRVLSYTLNETENEHRLSKPTRQRVVLGDPTTCDVTLQSSLETQTITIDNVSNSFPLFSNAEYVNFTIDDDTITLILDVNASFDGVCNLSTLMGREVSVAGSTAELEYFPISYQTGSYDQKWASDPYFNATEHKLYLLSGSGLMPTLHLEFRERSATAIPKVVGIGDFVCAMTITTAAEKTDARYNNLTSHMAGVGYADLCIQYAPDVTFEKTPYLPVFTHCEQLEAHKITSLMNGSGSSLDYNVSVIGLVGGAAPISRELDVCNLSLNFNLEYFPITYQNFSADQKWQLLPSVNETEHRLYLLSGSGIITSLNLTLNENSTTTPIPKVVGVGDLVGNYHIEVLAQGSNSCDNHLASRIVGVGYADLYAQYAPDTTYESTPFMPVFMQCEALEASTINSLVNGSESSVEYQVDILGRATGADPIPVVADKWNSSLDFDVEYFPITYQDLTFDQKWYFIPSVNETEHRLYLLSGSGLITTLNLTLNENTTTTPIPKVVGVGALVGNFRIEALAQGANSRDNHFSSRIVGVGYADLYAQYAPDPSYENITFIPTFSQCEHLQMSTNTAGAGVAYDAHVLGLANGVEYLEFNNIPLDSVAINGTFDLAYHSVNVSGEVFDEEWSFTPWQYNDILVLLRGTGNVTQLNFTFNDTTSAYPEITSYGYLSGDYDITTTILPHYMYVNVNGTNVTAMDESGQGGFGITFAPPPKIIYPDFTDTDTIGNWRTWLGVMNTGDTSTTLRLDVYNTDGSVAYSNSDFVTLDPKAVHFFRPGMTAGIAQGSAIVSGNNLAGTCHVNKNGGEGTKVYTALSSGSSTLNYPDFTDTDTSGNWRTWMGVMNTGDTSTTLRLDVYNPDGSLAYSDTDFVTLGPKAVHFFRPGITAGIAQGDVVVSGDNLAGTCHVNKNGGEGTKVYTAIGG